MEIPNDTKKFLDVNNNNIHPNRKMLLQRVSLRECCFICLFPSSPILTILMIVSPTALASESKQPPLRFPSKLFDEEWVLATEAANRNSRHVLQGRLSTAQSHLHKEAIRTAYLALAQHDTKAGDLQMSLGSLLRATDYCTTRTQTAQISLLILELSFGLQNYNQVRQYVTKVEHTLGAPAPSSPSNASATSLQEVAMKLKMASGLERLAQGEYAAAANIFTSLTTTCTSKLIWSGVTSPEDIALYASLLSLATNPRSSILELSEHPEALELVPAMKDLLSQWSRANYVKCMEAFSETSTLVPVIGDLYLYPRWKELCQKIREKCLMEYLKPYQCVRLDSMNQLFPSIPNLQDTMVDLMRRGLIPNARIDARANVLVKTNPKPSVDLAGMERRVLDDTYAMMIRLACLEYDLVVQDNKMVRGCSRGGGVASVRLDGEDSSDEDDDDPDTPMLDVDPHNSAANPEDLY